MLLSIVVIDYNTIIIILKWISSVLYFYEFIKFVVNKLSHNSRLTSWLQIAHSLQWTDIQDVASSSISLWFDMSGLYYGFLKAT